MVPGYNYEDPERPAYCVCFLVDVNMSDDRRLNLLQQKCVRTFLFRVLSEVGNLALEMMLMI